MIYFLPLSTSSFHSSLPIVRFVEGCCKLQRQNVLPDRRAIPCIPLFWLALTCQWVFGRFCCVRWYFVRPPDPVSKGSPVSLSRLNSSQRVALTAVASLRGAFACFRIRARRSGSWTRKSRISWVPFLRFQ